MRERVEHLVGDLANEIWIGTFHSICARLLRYEAEHFGQIAVSAFTTKTIDVPQCAAYSKRIISMIKT